MQAEAFAKILGASEPDAHTKIKDQLDRLSVSFSFSGQSEDIPTRAPLSKNNQAMDAGVHEASQHREHQRLISTESGAAVVPTRRSTAGRLWPSTVLFFLPHPPSLKKGMIKNSRGMWHGVTSTTVF